MFFVEKIPRATRSDGESSRERESAYRLRVSAVSFRLSNLESSRESEPLSLSLKQACKWPGQVAV